MNIKQGLKSRIIDNKKGTVVAIVIFIMVIVALFTKIATFNEVIGFLTLSGFFAWAKDSIFTLKG